MTQYSMRAYNAAMHPTQKIIVSWMRRQMDRHNWSPQKWAELTNGEVSPSTVTRALDDKRKDVTSIPTLDALARAAGTRSISDFLSSDADQVRPAGSINDAALKPVLAAVLKSMPKVELTDSLAENLAQSVQELLVFVSSDPAILSRPDAIEGAVRLSMSRFPEARPTA